MQIEMQLVVVAGDCMSLESSRLANRFTHCDSIRDLDRNRITIGRIDSNRFEVVIHSDFVVNQNLYHHALTLGA